MAIVVRSVRDNHEPPLVYRRLLVWRETLFVKFFTESLILAQDERWRRA